MDLTLQIEAEWLDRLRADEPGALSSRRDLRRASVLRQERDLRSMHSLIDLGGGDGGFSAYLSY